MNKKQVASAVAGTLLISVLLIRCTAPREVHPVAPEGLQNLASSQPSPSPSPAQQSDPSTWSRIMQARRCNPTDPNQNCIRLTGIALYNVLQDYDTDRVNGAIIAARNVAIEQGIQPVDVLRVWQRNIANDYVYEVKHGTGENSRRVRQDLIYRFSVAMIAESVIIQNQPMQAIDMPETDIACLMQTKVGVLPGVSCRD